MTSYPVHVDAQLDPHLSRWQWLVKWLLAIPHYVVLLFLWTAFVVLSLVAFVAILATGRYPRGIFDFNVGVMRWSWRVAYYAYGALGTDRYPPFTLEERPDYPAHLEVDYPERLSRGLVLVKWWLLAIPHYLVLALLLGGAGYAVEAGADNEVVVRSAGLIGLLVLFAGVVLLFTGRYPRPLFDFVLGLNRWVIRVAAYVALMTDVYPPFRLDQGGHEAGTPSLHPDPSPTPAAPVLGEGYPAPVESPPRWGAGRIVAVVTGSVLLVGSLGLGLAGGALAFADSTMRDDDGYLMSGTQSFATDTFALTSSSLQVHADVPGPSLPERMLGTVRLRATAADQPVFLGVAATRDVEDYLGSVRRATVVEADASPVYATSGTLAPEGAPADQGFWVAQTAGDGSQTLSWQVENGAWTVVVMNADASQGVGVDLAAGATVPGLDWLVTGFLVAGGIGVVLSLTLVLLAIGPFLRRPPS